MRRRGWRSGTSRLFLAPKWAAFIPVIVITPMFIKDPSFDTIIFASLVSANVYLWIVWPEKVIGYIASGVGIAERKPWLERIYFLGWAAGTAGFAFAGFMASTTMFIAPIAGAFAGIMLAIAAAVVLKIWDKI